MNIMDMFESLAQRGIVVLVVGGILALAIAIGLFFLLRAILCWYFKINKLVKELKKTNTYLAQIASSLERNNAPRVSQPVVSAPAPKQSAPAPVTAPTAAAPVAVAASAPAAEKKCPHCDTVLPASTVFCTNCGAKVTPEA